MAANLRPKIELVAEIKDAAGNAETTDSVALATDGISPTLTVVLTGTGAGTRQVTTGKITIDITSDEDIGQPIISISKVLDAATTTTASALGTAVDVTPELKAARTYQATYTGTVAGLYNVYVSALDTTASNAGTAGVNVGAISFLAASTALLYEIDIAVAAPTFGPATTDNADTYITVDFAAGGTDEGDEYTGTGASSASTKYDTNDTVTITSATLKSGTATAVDITLSTTDNKTFFYPASGLSVDDHVVTVEATDIAGNKLAATSGTITVTERKPFAMALNPGWNMVSIPGEPADSDINTVIPAAHPADTVLTYDPSVAGGWLTAIRGDDGLFAGTLTSITAARAYWIHTTTFEAISVTIPRLASGVATLPPTVAIAIGWNFVPVLDVSGASVATGDTGIEQTEYLANLTISRVYSFGTVANAWTQVATDANMTTGNGYWVYATKVGVLVP